MLSYEEFEARCNRMDAELAAEIARQNRFINSLEKALIEVSIQFFPETRQYKYLFIEALTIKTHQRAVELNELLDMMVGGITNVDQFGADNYKLPDRDVTLQEKQYLEDTLKNMPTEQHAYFIEINAERVQYEAEEREFLFQCHDKAKELIGIHFPEMINFSGNSIRRLNYSSYYDMYEWVFDFYHYAGDYINDELSG